MEMGMARLEAAAKVVGDYDPLFDRSDRKFAAEVVSAFLESAISSEAYCRTPVLLVTHSAGTGKAYRMWTHSAIRIPDAGSPVQPRGRTGPPRYSDDRGRGRP